MGNFKFTRTTSETIKIKGVLSEDGNSITYKNGNKDTDEEVTVQISDYLKRYAGEEITFGISTKDEFDLDN